MSRPHLPPLPPAESWVCIAYSDSGITTTCWRQPGRDYFNATQMRDYAALAVAQHLSARSRDGAAIEVATEAA